VIGYTVIETTSFHPRSHGLLALVFFVFRRVSHNTTISRTIRSKIANAATAIVPGTLAAGSRSQQRAHDDGKVHIVVGWKLVVLFIIVHAQNGQ
jgi:hypothetical protein